LAIAFALLAACASDALAADGSRDGTNWDGTWSGAVGRTDPWPVTVVIAGGKVVKFAERGVAFEVRFSQVTPQGVVFGDRINYQVELTRSGGGAATGLVRGRLGVGPAHLSRS
jgi:hypothetical protein